MLGDQDVLTALLTSKEFSEIPIHILRKGRQILQFNGIYGYAVAERIVAANRHPRQVLPKPDISRNLRSNYR